MNQIPIQDLIRGLRERSDDEFGSAGVHEFLNDRPVDIDSLQKYLFWSDSYYTRNLIYKDERFEVMAICWEKGQVSTIHDHSDQKCWMTVAMGLLKGRNFAIDELDVEKGYCRLSETASFELSLQQAAMVDLGEPVHQVWNASDTDRTVSVHIYSKPYDRCRIYMPETNSFKEILLSYTSIDGQLCNGVSLE